MIEARDTLRDIQLCQLDILKEVVRICEKHNIKYYLAWGTMLGAVRHQGFIPWDDDIDIYMTFADLKKFESYCKKELKSKYFLQCPDNEPFMGWLFYKVRRNGTTMKEASIMNDVHIKHHGVWIDIFPLVDLANESQKREKQLKLFRLLQKTRFEYDDAAYASWKGKVVISIRNIRTKWKEKILWKEVVSLGKGSDYYISLENNFFDGMEKYIPISCYEKSLFESTTKYQFEDAYFDGVKDFNKYLTGIYGKDYMIPKKYNIHISDYKDVDLTGFYRDNDLEKI